MLGRAVEAFATCFDREKPDLVVVLGDRFEIMAAALAAVSMRVALAHIEGGHVTQGAIDERYRHAITKLADIHFPALAAQRDRLISLGESPDRIIQSGAIGAALARQAEPLPTDAMMALTGFDPSLRPLTIATFHSETATDMCAEEIVRFIVELIERSRLIFRPPPAYLFTMANIDAGGETINEGLAQIAQARSDDVRIIPSIGGQYLPAVAAAAGVIGNSSSGILEAAAMGIPVVNIGRRQEGRDRYGDVMDCDWNVEEALTLMRIVVSAWAEGRPRPSAREGEGQAPWEVIAEGLIRFNLQTPADKPFCFPAVPDRKPQ